MECYKGAVSSGFGDITRVVKGVGEDEGDVWDRRW